MNATRQNRPHSVSERAIMELVETLDEMMFMAGRYGPDDMRYHHLMRRLDRPLRHICDEAGIPELYNRHRIHMREVLGPIAHRERVADEDEDDTNE